MKFSADKIPLYTVLVKQFKNALLEVAKRSEVGHKKYIENDADYMNFKTVSIDEYDNALMRHLFEDGEDTQLEHYTAVAWNSLARLELYLEQKNNQIEISKPSPSFNPEKGELVNVKHFNGIDYLILDIVGGHYTLEQDGAEYKIYRIYDELIPIPGYEYKNGFKSN